MALHVLALAGGSGTRLWPLSRQATPKHLLPIGPGGSTLLRTTVERVIDLGESVHVVTATSQEQLCRDALVGLETVDFIAEPEARGTGPALALATRLIAREDPDAVIVSVHADAYVGDVDAYRAAVIAAAGWAQVTEGLATVGLTPTYAATGLGYIALGPLKAAEGWRPTPSAPANAARDAQGCMAYQSLGFIEKPDLERAQGFLAQGTHLWNLGLFAWPAKTFEREVAAADPELSSLINDVVEARVRGDADNAAALYATAEKVPVEPLVFERTPQLTVVRADFPWSDVGSWKDLHEVRVNSGDGDANGNVVDGDAVLVETKNSMVVSRGGRVVAVAGMENVVVVDTGDAVLVVPADQAQRVKEIVEALTAAEKLDAL